MTGTFLVASSVTLLLVPIVHSFGLVAQRALGGAYRSGGEGGVSSRPGRCQGTFAMSGLATYGGAHCA